MGYAPVSLLFFWRSYLRSQKWNKASDWEQLIMYNYHSENLICSFFVHVHKELLIGLVYALFDFAYWICTLVISK